MIAGANALGKILIFDYNSHMIAIFTTIVTILITFGGLKFITKINYILVPLMVIVIFATCILSFVYIPQVSDIQIVQVGLQNYFMGFGSSILYVSLNMLMSGLLFMEIGNKYTSKQIKTASLVFGASVSLLIVLISVSLLTSNFTIFNSELPLIALALNINKMWSYGVALIVWFAILTSTIGNCYVVAMYLKKHLKSYKLSVVLTGLFALMFSVIGFSTIVGVVYPIMGVIGLVLILLIFKRTNNVNINVFSQKHKTSLHSSAKL